MVVHAYNPSTREFAANLGYIAKLCLIETKTKQKKVN
jgi:hypothetical protein